MTDDPRKPVDGPTAMSPTSGHLQGGSPEEPTLPEAGLASYGPTTYGPITAHDEPTMGEADEPTVPGPGAPGGGPPVAHPTWQNEPTHAEPPPGGIDGGPTTTHPTWQNEPTHPEPSPGGVDGGPTIAHPIEPSAQPGWQTDPAWSDEPTVDEPTVAVASDEPTTTGPTIASWPLDQFEPPPPTDLVWQPDVAPEPPSTGRSPAYYVTLGAAVVLVVGLVALAALVTVMRPRDAVAGDASAGVPQIPSTAPPPPTTTTSTTQTQAGPFTDLAAHPLSSSTTRMPDATCALPRFDPADDKQAAFYAAAKKCADDAWRPVLQGIEVTGDVAVVTVTGTPAQTQSCGEIAPTNAATECDGTVYMTPAYLRDQEQLGRYPGKYLGIFLREYARALQFTTGLEELVGKVTSGSAADLDTKTDQQATCLAGVTSGAMAGRGAVDSNITGEIRQRLTTVDAPPDASSLLDKGFQQRTPAACNTWTK